MYISTQRVAALLKVLPPITAAIVWDVVRGSVGPETIELAQEATPQEWNRYTIVRIVGGGNPDPGVAEGLSEIAWDMGMPELLDELKGRGDEPDDPSRIVH